MIPKDARPTVIARWADANKLLISGLLENGEAMAGHAAVVRTTPTFRRAGHTRRRPSCRT
jgi:hypothetical protein